MDVEDSLRWLFSLERFGMKLGLEAVGILLDDLGKPCFAVPKVIVAGTNGKGSVAAMTASILTAAGARILLYTSPHVASVRERIRLDGRPITPAALASHLQQIRTVIGAARRRRRLPHHPTFFEVLTAAALLHGRRRRAQALVLEVGLGGRFDATNAVPAEVGVITSIDKDHAPQLGKDLRQVARNKAGIIAGKHTVLTAATGTAALDVIQNAAREEGARLVRVKPGAARLLDDGRWSLDPGVVKRVASGRRRLPGRHKVSPPCWPLRLPPTRLGLPGPFQGENAVLAMGAAAALAPAIPGLRLTSSKVRRGLATTVLAGRFEVRRAARGRTVILDAAHNPAAATRLAAAVAELAAGRPVTLLFGVMADKDVAGMARALFGLPERFVFCRPRHRRAQPPASLPALTPAAARARVVPDPRRAWQAALEATPAGGILLVAGSFYLLGDVSPCSRRLPLQRS